MQHIQLVRKYEADVVKDIKAANSLVMIRKTVQSNADVMALRMAALHSQRRIFIHFFDHHATLLHPTDDSATASSTFRSWFLSQYTAFVDELKSYVSASSAAMSGTGGDSDVQLQVAAVRTMLEFVKREGVLQGATSSATFGRQTFEALLTSLVQCRDVPVDVLVMVRDEVFCHLDCVYYTLLVLRQVEGRVKAGLKKGAKVSISAEASAAAAAVTVKNILDLLRMLAFDDVLEQVEEAREAREGAMAGDDEAGDEHFLVPLANHDTSSLGAGGSDCDDSDEEEEVAAAAAPARTSNNTEADDSVYVNKKRQHQHQQQQAAVASAQSKQSKQSKQSNAGASRRKLNRQQQLTDAASYRRAFSSAWLTLLSISSSQALGTAGQSSTRLILKHLGEHVIPHLTRPLLLADYLTVCYRSGVASSSNANHTAASAPSSSSPSSAAALVPLSDASSAICILALESLLKLIVEHNLDYPSFFTSLYQLTTSLQVFSSRYSAKFLKLLSLALQSSNLPSYLVAAFCKRLLFVATQGSSVATAEFCLAQTAALLRAHPQCMPLLHRQKVQVGKAGDGPAAEADAATVATAAAANASIDRGDGSCNLFDYREDRQLESANALHSSLFELELLRRHFYGPVNAMAEALAVNAEVTKGHTSVASSAAWTVGTYVGEGDSSYTAIVEKELVAGATAGLGAAAGGDGLGISRTKKHGDHRFRRNKEDEDEDSNAESAAALNYRVSTVLIQKDSTCGRCFGI